MDQDRHGLLQRQLLRCYGSEQQVPENLVSLVDLVDQAYRESDADRGMLERSLELSSDELFEANAELRALLGALAEVVLELDRSGEILSVRAGASKDLVLDSGSLVGRQLGDGPVFDATANLQETLELALESQVAQTVDYSLVVDGTARRYRALFVPSLDHVLAVIRSLAHEGETADTEAPCEDNQVSARQTESPSLRPAETPSEVAKFAEALSTAIHDLNNALTGIVGEASLLAMDLEGAAREAAGSIERSATHASKLIREMAQTRPPSVMPRPAQF